MLRHPGGARFHLELRALPDDNAPPPARLKAVLKLLLRRFNFRCLAVTVEEVPAPPPPVAQAPAGDVEAVPGPAVPTGPAVAPVEAAEAIPGEA